MLMRWKKTHRHPVCSLPYCFSWTLEKDSEILKPEILSVHVFFIRMVMGMTSALLSFQILFSFHFFMPCVNWTIIS